VAKAASNPPKGARRAPVPPPSGQRTSMSRFVAESWAELRKTQWPTGQQVAQGTLVVGFVTLVFALYLALVDVGAKQLVDAINSIVD
jgi:preprotein translocase SecE subunit